jgi:hypothetical protein
MQLHLFARPPFSLSTVIRSHGWIHLAPFTEDGTNGSLIYITQLSSGRVLDIQVREAPGGVSVDVEGACLLALGLVVYEWLLIRVHKVPESLGLSGS